VQSKIGTKQKPDDGDERWMIVVMVELIYKCTPCWIASVLIGNKRKREANKKYILWTTKLFSSKPVKSI
jgi:hypothetical protein